MQTVRYTAAKRREIAAARAAEQTAEDRRQASLTLDAFLAEIAAGYGVTHNSNVADGEDVEFFTARHADLVAAHGDARV